MLKKVAKALDEMAKNEELMEGILAAAVGADMEDDADNEGRVGGGEIEHPLGSPDGLGGEIAIEKEGERLGTIGEDGDEDRLIYDTKSQQQNKNNINNNNNVQSKKQLDAEDEEGEDNYEDDQEQQQEEEEHQNQQQQEDDDYAF